MFITLFQAEYTSPEFKNRILKPGDFVRIRNGIQYAVSEEIRLCDFIERNEIKGVVQRITRRVDSAYTPHALPFPHTVIAEAKDLANPITVEDVSGVKPGDIAFFWDGGFSDIIGSARTDSHGNNEIPCESGDFELAEIHKIVRAENNVVMYNINGESCPCIEIAKAKDPETPLKLHDVIHVRPGDVAVLWSGRYDVISKPATAINEHGAFVMTGQIERFTSASIRQILRPVTQDTPEEKEPAQPAEEHSPRLTIAGENEHLNVNAKDLYEAIKAEHQKSSQPDPINHPAHYGGQDNPYEAIKVIEAWNANFNIGNTLKYIARAGKKDNSIQDLQKAKWYLEREIQNLMNA